MKGLKNLYLAAVVFAATASLAAYATGCGEDGHGGMSTGTLTLSVSDAPVDLANRVVVLFNGVEVKPEEGDSVSFQIEGKREIDLLALDGTESRVLLNSASLPAGQYNWIRLSVEAERDVLDSYIELEDLSVESLWVPSGEEVGLKLNRNFIVPAGGFAAFTVDFDLRKSVHDPEGFDDYILRPTLRVIDNTEIGSITGIVDSALLGPEGENAVYVYDGADAVPDDMGGNPEPVNTAPVDTESGQYTVGFLLEGTYTAAFTSQAGKDDPSTDDEVDFLHPATLSVKAEESTVHNFNP
jgi:hypothetical protein